MALYTYDNGLQFGNWLYFLMHYYKENHKVVYEPTFMDQWLTLFPKLKYFIKENPIDQNDVTTLKGYPIHYHQVYDLCYSDLDLSTFIDRFLKPDAKKQVKPVEDVIVNVRRTDFYLNDRMALNYGFDVQTYLKKALMIMKHNINKDNLTIGIVSDDKKWCEENLQFLSQFGQLHFYDKDPIDNFKTLFSAQHLVLANSTFSYWGAYLAQALRNNVKVVAPAFNTYLMADGQQVAYTKKWKLKKVTTLKDLKDKGLTLKHTTIDNLIPTLNEVLGDNEQAELEQFFDQFSDPILHNYGLKKTTTKEAFLEQMVTKATPFTMNVSDTFTITKDKYDCVSILLKDKGLQVMVL